MSTRDRSGSDQQRSSRYFTAAVIDTSAEMWAQEYFVILWSGQGRIVSDRLP